jgi:hypothetical protein
MDEKLPNVQQVQFYKLFIPNDWKLDLLGSSIGFDSRHLHRDVVKNNNSSSFERF